MQGKACGFGTFIDSSKNYKYTGTFLKNYQEGIGTEIDRNTKMVGEFELGKKHGRLTKMTEIRN